MPAVHVHVMPTYTQLGIQGSLIHQAACISVASPKIVTLHASAHSSRTIPASVNSAMNPHTDLIPDLPIPQHPIFSPPSGVSSEFTKHLIRAFNAL